MSETSCNGLQPRTSEMQALAQRGYIMGSKIGQGSYAAVHLSDYQDPNSKKHQRLACKIFDKTKAPTDFLVKFFPRELDILTKLENPNVIQVHSILQRGPRVFIFMRYAENGDMLNFIKLHGKVSELNAREWFHQMTTGLEYLHNKQIAHRDLKCENVLLTKRYNVKLADFGFARHCVDQDGHRVLSKTFCGSAAYAAPEIVSGIPYNPKLADIWSLGVILFIMLNARMPFDDSNLKDLLKDQLHKNWSFRSSLKDVLSQGAKSMVHKLLEPDLTLRINLDMIFSHPWVDQRSKRQPNSTVQSWKTVAHEKPYSDVSPTRQAVAGNSPT